MKLLTPAARISFCIVLVTISLLLVGDLLGLFPSREKAMLDSREKTSESLAILFSALASKGEMEALGFTLKTFVERNPDVISAGLRNEAGQLISAVGNHMQNWTGMWNDKSTMDHVVVPIFESSKRWGALEVKFSSLDADTPFEALSNTIYGMVLYVGLFGFGAYFFLIRRTIRELDPSSVIPERVSAAFNALAEGLLILDEKQQVVLANSAFAEKFERDTSSLVGYKASELSWIVPDQKSEDYLMPWEETMREGTSLIGVPVKVKTPSGEERSLVVNSTPISDANGKCRGVLATFDDITELVEKNEQLETMVCQLEDNKHEIEEQNEELNFLATHDPMTDCLNRRSFNEGFKQLFDIAKSEQTELICIMADLDKFKLVNDNFGHGVGDEVIKLLAGVLHANTRKEDLVARYGGEEFCLILPGIMIDRAYKIANRIRLKVKEESLAKFSAGPRVTVSLGIASISSGAADPDELNYQSDKALYVAKESGRNRVVIWDAERVEEMENKKAKEEAAATNRVPVKTTEVPEDVKRLKVRVKQLESIAFDYSKKIEYQANYDSLTGLPNQILFYDRIQQAVARCERYDSYAAVVTIDVNLFKRVNTSLGRAVGDKLLKEVGLRLNRALRETDGLTLLSHDPKELLISHLGADEFGILLTDITELDSVSVIVTRLQDLLSEAIEINEQKIYITSSIGLSLCPANGNTADTLIKHATIARYHAKSLPGQNNYKFYDSQMSDNTVKQIELESELKDALVNDEFVLFYQPKVNSETMTIVGLEALIRWNHPKRGLLSPVEFIEIAERSSVIVGIGEWVIKRACIDLSRMQKMGFAELSVAVNISTIQLRQDNIRDFILHSLESSGLKPGCLELEITESVIMDNISTAADILHDLHDSGLKISIDDFGTGYSSLSYLKYLPLDTLKIDRSFVKDILIDKNDRSIVKTIISMAHNLNLNVVAEGVEEVEQWNMLRSFSCDLIQGYYFSRPIPFNEVAELLYENIHPETQAIN